eukprot:g10821.t1
MKIVFPLILLLLATNTSGTFAGKIESATGLRHRGTRTDQHAPRYTTSWQSVGALTEENNPLVRTSQGQECDERWTSWPAVQASALATGNILLFQIFPSIGNLFLTLETMMQVSLLLEVALVLDCEKFPGFRVAFDPSEITWDLDPTTITQRENRAPQDVDSSGEHVFKFRDGVLILSDSRLLLLAHKLNVLKDGIPETAAAVEGYRIPSLRHMVPRLVGATARPGPCAWNLLLRRSSSMVQSMAAQNPWAANQGTTPDDYHPMKYVAWHIRTSDGESASSFNADLHKYVFHGQRSDNVSSLYLAATKSAEDECPSVYPGSERGTPVYISSNSKEMARNCSIDVTEWGGLPGFVDLGIAAEDSHTQFSKNPNTTAINAFIDYLYLMDADVIVRTGSSFSGTVANVKGMKCHHMFVGG